jgi:hypothetical protein
VVGGVDEVVGGDCMLLNVHTPVFYVQRLLPTFSRGSAKTMEDLVSSFSLSFPLLSTNITHDISASYSTCKLILIPLYSDMTLLCSGIESGESCLNAIKNVIYT